MKKALLFIGLIMCVQSALFSQIGSTPTTFNNGINLPNTPVGTITDTVALFNNGNILKSEFSLNDIAKEITSIEALKTVGGVSRGDFVKTSSYYVGLNVGGAIYEKVDPAGLTPNDMDLILATDGDIYKLSQPTVTPYMFGALQEDVAHTSKLQAFFDYVDAEDVVGDWRGTWEIDNTITITGVSQEYICGSIETNNSALVEPAISIEAANSEFRGLFELTGSTSAAYSSRNSLTGIDFTNGGGRNSFDYIRVTGFKGYGIRLYGSGGGNNTMNIIEKVKITACGSTGSGYLTGSGTATVSNVVNTGSSGSVNQRSTITVNAVDNAWVENELLEIDGKIHTITAPIVGTDIEVYPWVDTAFTGTIYGLNGGFLIAGADGASMNIGQIDAIRCGVVRTGSLYGSIIDVIQTQSCGVGYAIGYVYNSNNLGSVVNQLYTENNTFDFAQITGVNTNTKINMVTEQINNFFIMQPQTTLFADQNNVPFPGVITRNSQNYSSTLLQKKRNLISAASSVKMDNDKLRNKVSMINNNPTFEIRWDEPINNIFGLDEIFINVYGTGSNNNPTGTINFTLDPDDQTAGITIMGGISYALSGLTEPAFINMYFDHANQNWIVSNSTGLPDTTAAWEIIDPNGGYLTVTRDDNVTVSGDEIGGIEFKTGDGSFAAGDEILSRLIGVADGDLGTGSNSKTDLVYYARQVETQAYTEQFRLKANGIITSEATVAEIEAEGLSVVPTKEWVNGVTGWADYADTVYTSGSPLSLAAATDTTLPNNAGTTVDSQKPDDVTSFYDGTVITGRNGDGIAITVEFNITPTNANTTYVEVWFDITGGTGTPTNLANLYKRIITFPKGNGVERPVNFTINGYTLGTWEANGAVVKVRADNTADIYDIRYVVTRTHKAK